SASLPCRAIALATRWRSGSGLRSASPRCASADFVGLLTLPGHRARYSLALGLRPSLGFASLRVGRLRRPPYLAGPSRSLLARARAPAFARLRLAARRPTSSASLPLRAIVPLRLVRLELAQNRKRPGSEHQGGIVAEAQLGHALDRQRARDPAAQERRRAVEARLVLVDAVLVGREVDRAPEHERVREIGRHVDPRERDEPHARIG